MKKRFWIAMLVGLAVAQSAYAVEDDLDAGSVPVQCSLPKIADQSFKDSPSSAGGGEDRHSPSAGIASGDDNSDSDPG